LSLRSIRVPMTTIRLRDSRDPEDFETDAHDAEWREK
jgi:hypothetical protein